MPALRADLLAWYDRHRRDLPWRPPPGGLGDPYATLVSEVMLQQTRVETVLPYYSAWMRRYPSFQALAAADDDEVIAAWSGLGYYGRARRLHAAAKAVVADGMPADARGWAELPGVGPYTAAAVASIASAEAVACVDGNVERVASRLAAIRTDVSRAPGRRAVRDAAGAWVDPDRPGDWNQAMMELGATVCRPAPRCPSCPVQAHCEGRRRGVEDQLPVKAAKKPPRTEDVHFGMVVGDGRLLVVRRPDDGLLGGTWALPGGALATALQDHVRDQAGLQVQVSKSAAQTQHVFTHRIWQMRVHACHVLDVERRAAAWPVQWVPLNRLESVGFSTAMKRALASAGLPVP